MCIKLSPQIKCQKSKCQIKFNQIQCSNSLRSSINFKRQFKINFVKSNTEMDEIFSFNILKWDSTLTAYQTEKLKSNRYFLAECPSTRIQFLLLKWNILFSYQNLDQEMDCQKTFSIWLPDLSFGWRIHQRWNDPWWERAVECKANKWFYF